MIVTAQPFFNELDLLEIKCRELEGVVDAHIIVESRLTFTGIPKPLHFADNKDRFRGLPIVHVVVDLPPVMPSAWHREHIVHKEILAAVRAFDPQIVIWGDVDEVPRRDVVERFLASGLRTVTLDLDRILFYFDRYDPSDRPTASRMGYFERGRDHQPWRGEKYPEIPTAGWHFQYFPFGRKEHLIDKLLATSHAIEDDDVSIWSTRRQVREGKLPGLERTVPYPLESLPPFIVQNRDRWPHSFFPS